jgi:hypothetical protein
MIDRLYFQVSQINPGVRFGRSEARASDGPSPTKNKTTITIGSTLVVAFARDLMLSGAVSSLRAALKTFPPHPYLPTSSPQPEAEMSRQPKHQPNHKQAGHRRRRPDHSRPPTTRIHFSLWWRGAINITQHQSTEPSRSARLGEARPSTSCSPCPHPRPTMSSP